MADLDEISGVHRLLPPRARCALPNVQACTPKLRRAQGVQVGLGTGVRRLTKVKPGLKYIGKQRGEKNYLCHECLT